MGIYSQKKILKNIVIGLEKNRKAKLCLGALLGIQDHLDTVVMGVDTSEALNMYSQLPKIPPKKVVGFAMYSRCHIKEKTLKKMQKKIKGTNLVLMIVDKNRNLGFI